MPNPRVGACYNRQDDSPFMTTETAKIRRKILLHMNQEPQRDQENVVKDADAKVRRLPNKDVKQSLKLSKPREKRKTSAMEFYTFLCLRK